MVCKKYFAKSDNIHSYLHINDAGADSTFQFIQLQWFGDSNRPHFLKRMGVNYIGVNCCGSVHIICALKSLPQGSRGVHVSSEYWTPRDPTGFI